MPSPTPRHGRNDMLPRIPERSLSFNGKTSLAPTTDKLRRPKTVPDLKSSMRYGVASPSSPSLEDSIKPKKLTKVLLNVTVQGSAGAVQVITSPELTVKDLISAAVKQYVKEGRRPVISCFNVDDFDLHYSQFSLESLDREEKISELGSRNFLLCKRRREVAEAVASSSSSCSKEAEKANKLGGSPYPPWLNKFMSSLLAQKQ